MDRFARVLSYAAIFLVGYYMGGGCEKKSDDLSYSANRKFSIIERQLRQYENRIDQLERRLENSTMSNEYIERKEFWNKQS